MKANNRIELFLCYEEGTDVVAHLNHCQGSGLFTYTPIRIAQGYAVHCGTVQVVDTG